MAQQKLKVSEYARIMQCDASTVYRQIQQGKLETEKIDGVLHVIVDEDELQGHAIASEDQRIQLLLKENVWLKERIEHLEKELSEKDQRHDTIVLAMTKQLERKELMIEDMRKRKAGFLAWFSGVFNRWWKQPVNNPSQPANELS